MIDTAKRSLATYKNVVWYVLKGRKMPSKVKTATMDVKTTSMDDKSMTLIDKTTSMFGVLGIVLLRDFFFFILSTCIIPKRQRQRQQRR